MATNNYDLPIKYTSTINPVMLQEWFMEQGFEQVLFQDGLCYTYAQGIAHKFIENPGYITYYKEDIAGSVLVFETQLNPTIFHCIAYSPLYLFGILSIRLRFVKKASWITKYRQHGHTYLTLLQEYLQERNG